MPTRSFPLLPDEDFSLTAKEPLGRIAARARARARTRHKARCLPLGFSAFSVLFSGRGGYDAHGEAVARKIPHTRVDNYLPRSLARSRWKSKAAPRNLRIGEPLLHICSARESDYRLRITRKEDKSCLVIETRIFVTLKEPAIFQRFLFIL